MELRYMGFEQAQNMRCYRFDRLIKGELTVRFTITADLALFLEHGVHLQEGPTLCAYKLAADLAIEHLGEHHLTNDDLIAHLQARTLAAMSKGKARNKRPMAPARSGIPEGPDARNDHPFERMHFETPDLD
jgi:hypothetical protein